MTLSKTKSASDTRNQHERFVRDAIARSLLTLPFASLNREDPFGTIYGYHKHLLEAADTGELPTNETLLNLFAMIREDASIHEAAGNHLKADIERRWTEGLAPTLHLTTEEVAALRKAHEHVRVHMAHQHPWEVRDTAMSAISKTLVATVGVAKEIL